jgi:hypothetical protein
MYEAVKFTLHVLIRSLFVTAQARASRNRTRVNILLCDILDYIKLSAIEQSWKITVEPFPTPPNSQETNDEEWIDSNYDEDEVSEWSGSDDEKWMDEEGEESDEDDEIDSGTENLADEERQKRRAENREKIEKGVLAISLRLLIIRKRIFTLLYVHVKNLHFECFEVYSFFTVR